MKSRLGALVYACVLGCGSVGGDPVDAALSPDGGGAPADAAGSADAGPPLPLIGEALDCGETSMEINDGTDLQRLELDPELFPEALCNDGTRAVIYFRPHTGAANANRWVIQLQGGGGCNGPDDCAERWCSVNTGFGMGNMTAPDAMPGMPSNGIFEPRVDNPIAGYNHVFLPYCSSDAWGGRALDVPMEGVHPVSGAPLAYRIHFAGNHILDAALATIRRDGVGASVYTLGGGATTLPDLDDADAVVLAGASAGGGGVILQGDRVGALLRANNPGLGSYGLLIDSVTGPSYEDLDFSMAVSCPDPCSYQLATELAAAADRKMTRDEDSCLTWHAANAPDTAWRCDDFTHLVRHHVTSPMFIRMGQRDTNISRNYQELGLLGPSGETFSVDLFQQLVRGQMGQFPDLPATAEENVVVPPGIFSPTCENHETLRETGQVFDVTIEVGGVDYTMFDIIGNWATGASPSVAITQPGGSETCAP